MENLQDKLAAKSFLANKADRAKNTQQIVGKLDELKPSEAQKTASEAMSSFVQMLKGDKGEEGYTPVKGTDYYTEDEIQQIKHELTPQKGIDYVDGLDGLDGKDGITPQKGIDYVDGKDGEPGESITGPVGLAGKDGSPDTPEQIVEKLATIKKAWLELSQIKGLQELLNAAGSDWLNQAKGFVPRSLDSLFDVQVRGVITDGQSLIWNKAKQKWIPGSSSGSGTLASETPVGTVDGSNSVFTVSSTPVFVTVNGQVMAASGVDYTYSSGTITFVTPPETGSVLISFHN